MIDSARAVFLDKDGTLVEDVPYSVDPERLRFRPGAREGLSALHSAGYQLVVVSNQSGVARGLFPEEKLRAVKERLGRLVLAAGATLEGFYYCPHHPQGTVAAYACGCVCRKPRPGLLVRAAAERGIDLVSSWMVGDILDDVESGRRAGCRTVLIEDGGETEWRMSRGRLPHHLATDLWEAARIILAMDGAPCHGTPARVEEELLGK